MTCDSERDSAYKFKSLHTAVVWGTQVGKSGWTAHQKDSKWDTDGKVMHLEFAAG